VSMGSFGSDRHKKTSIGSTCAKEEFRLCPDAGLSLKLADEQQDAIVNEKESVAGTTTNERRTVDWIDDAGLSLELADKEEELSIGLTWQRMKENVDGINGIK